MALYQLHTQQFLPTNIQDAWSFFSQPGNLNKITPDSMNFDIKSHIEAEMYEGMVIAYKIQPFPLTKLSWITEITHVNEPHLFIDEQRFGPYQFWHHEHHFHEQAEGILMEDLLHYKMPYGFIGEMIHTLQVKNQVQGIFTYRFQKLSEIFETTLEATQPRISFQRLV